MSFLPPRCLLAPTATTCCTSGTLHKTFLLVQARASQKKKKVTCESELPEGIGIIKWWGVSTKYVLYATVILMALQQIAHRCPVWASLAHDYLAIMASSGSSKWAFSQGGIMVSKRRSRLKGDIVEALQVYKCSL
jgi:hAT family C-terminal dimerisation region